MTYQDRDDEESKFTSPFKSERFSRLSDIKSIPKLQKNYDVDDFKVSQSRSNSFFSDEESSFSELSIPLLVSKKEIVAQVFKEEGYSFLEPTDTGILCKICYQ